MVLQNYLASYVRLVMAVYWLVCHLTLHNIVTYIVNKLTHSHFYSIVVTETWLSNIISDTVLPYDYAQQLCRNDFFQDRWLFTTLFLFVKLKLPMILKLVQSRSSPKPLLSLCSLYSTKLNSFIPQSSVVDLLNTNNVIIATWLT